MIRSVAASALLALATLVAAPASASPTDDVRAAMFKLAAASSYEMTFSTPRGTGIFDFVKPGAMHMRMGGMEMIRVGNAMYMKQGGAWRKFPGGASFTSPAAQAQDMAREANGLSATDLGMKPVGGELMHAYRVTPKSGHADTVYIGHDGYPRRVEGIGHGDAVDIGKYNQIAPIHAPV